jgi:murein DD-endopeptidase MepM/ murein hydrolase activator NlpD
MRLFLVLFFVIFSVYLYSQDTTDIAVDSIHRNLFLRSSLKKLQNWQSNITRSNENINIVKSISDSFEIELDPFNIPFDGYMTSHYGKRWNEWHPGVDIGLRVGDSVSATWDGVVRYAMMNRGGYGNLVIIRHRNGLETYYAHLSKIKVVSGQRVYAGQVIGLGGNTGRSFGPHLHFEIRFYDVCIDPEFLINFYEKKVIASSFLVSPEFIRGQIPIMRTGAPIDEFESVEFVAGVILPLAGQLESKTPHNMRKYYVVKKGDCLNKIANINNISVQDLCRLNKIDELKWLLVGQRLRVR